MLGPLGAFQSPLTWVLAVGLGLVGAVRLALWKGRSLVIYLGVLLLFYFSLFLSGSAQLGSAPYSSSLIELTHSLTHPLAHSILFRGEPVRETGQGIGRAKAFDNPERDSFGALFGIFHTFLYNNTNLLCPETSGYAILSP